MCMYACTWLASTWLARGGTLAQRGFSAMYVQCTYAVASRTLSWYQYIDEVVRFTVLHLAYHPPRTGASCLPRGMQDRKPNRVPFNWVGLTLTHPSWRFGRSPNLINPFHLHLACSSACKYKVAVRAPVRGGVNPNACELFPDVLPNRIPSCVVGLTLTQPSWRFGRSRAGLSALLAQLVGPCLARCMHAVRAPVRGGWYARP